jgi:DNA end-binding protein Ku
MADQLIEAMTVPFSPKDYKDEFRKSVDDLLHQKAKGKKIIKEKSKSNRTSNVIDIMDALRKSLASKKTKPTNKSRATKKKASKS